MGCNAFEPNLPQSFMNISYEAVGDMVMPFLCLHIYFTFGFSKQNFVLLYRFGAKLCLLQPASGLIKYLATLAAGQQVQSLVGQYRMADYMKILFKLTTHKEFHKGALKIY
jgi:hypothetical protein